MKEKPEWGCNDWENHHHEWEYCDECSKNYEAWLFGSYSRYSLLTILILLLILGA